MNALLKFMSSTDKFYTIIKQLALSWPDDLKLLSIDAVTCCLLMVECKTDYHGN